MSAHPFAEGLGISTEPGPGGAPVCRVPITPAHRNPAGVTHGGLAFALVDTVMGAHIYMADDRRGDDVFLSTDVHIRFVRAVTEGVLVATARIESRTRRTRVLSARVVRESDDALVATATGHFLALARSS